jgi:hypothetical protein
VFEGPEPSGWGRAMKLRACFPHPLLLPCVAPQGVEVPHVEAARLYLYGARLLQTANALVTASLLEPTMEPSCLWV